jgi:perosamine synthetase
MTADPSAPRGLRPPGHQIAGQVSRLEEAIAGAFGARHVIAVSSGTAALHCALLACGIKPGDEVLIPAACVVMSAAPIVYCGARPVFVDCSSSGASMDPGDLIAKITARTTAILAVDLWGRCGDMDWLAGLASSRGLRLIEDSCQAHGTRYRGTMAGLFGDAGTLSLHHAKLVECGEGGVIMTRDEGIAQRCRALRTHWQDPPGGQLPMSGLGYNYRLAEPLAELATASTARFPEYLDRRKKHMAFLAAALSELPGFAVRDPQPGEDWNGYSPLFHLSLPRPREFCRRLAACGVPNSTATFGLVACDQRPLFAPYAAGAPCGGAAAMIDSSLAVALTNRVTDAQVGRYAEIITAEAQRWTA